MNRDPLRRKEWRKMRKKQALQISRKRFNAETSRQKNLKFSQNRYKILSYQNVRKVFNNYVRNSCQARPIKVL
ncbi:hypothetical protein [Caballeronia insecticola]|uniref:hypothetical protein n=1 Tax=Caballeronia insecticola TaxID=758793 RepID=UPI0011842AEB|nr:hypothetical protein [Caballeronia insecticola]